MAAGARRAGALVLGPGANYHPGMRLISALCLSALPLTTAALALGGTPESAPQAQRPRVLFVYGEDEYGSAETLPGFARELAEARGYECVLATSRERELPGLEQLDQADMLVLFLRFREASDAELERLDRWFEAGKPAVALRTTSHAFWSQKGWFPARFGGHYKSHAPNGAGTLASVAPDAARHPVLSGFPSALEMGYGGTYNTQPLGDGAEVLLFGRTGDLPAEPLAWTYSAREGQRLLYTSLGSRENFEREAFRTLIGNAIAWGLGEEVPPGGVFGGDEVRRPLPEQALPAPPPLEAPEDALILFGGSSLGAWRHWDPSVEPRAIQLDARADTTSGGPVYEDARWTVEGRALRARPGFGDIVTREEFGDVHVHLDFLLPPEPDWVPRSARGASGVFVAGRWEVALSDSYGVPIDDSSCGALSGAVAPAVDAALPRGTWQRLDLSYSQRAGEPPSISVWLNDRRVLTDVRPEEATTYGFLRPVPGAQAGGVARHVADTPASSACDWGAESFAVAARFKTSGNGTLVSKCAPEGSWSPDAKALFLRDGRLVYDIGWVGALTTAERWNDDRWHRVVLTSDDGHARIFVDGELAAENEEFGAADEPHFVLKVGAANHDFAFDYEGQVRGVRFYRDGLTRRQAVAVSRGEESGAAPSYSWDPDGAEPREAPADGIVRAPLRLQADTSAVRFANIWVAPLADVDHAALIAGLDDGAYHRGKEIYLGLCIACHGADGTRPTNPKARPFAVGELLNGHDPLSLFRTVTAGWRDMPGNDWLRPEQRYDVIHYVREEFLRQRNPDQYFEVTDEWLAALPKGRSGRTEEADEELEPRDFGPALASQLGDDVGACLTVRLDADASLAYDLQLMESPGAWVGGFLDLSQTQHYLQRGEGKARPAGAPLPGLDGWAWGLGGELEWDRARRPERGLVPREWLDYHGHWVHGDDVVLSYSIDQRAVLERPGVDRSSGLPVVTQRLSIAPGASELVLRTLHPVGSGMRLQVAEGEAWRYGDEGDEYVSVACVLGSEGVSLDGDGVLSIPASEDVLELWVLRFGSHEAGDVAAIEVLLSGIHERPLPASPRTLLGGGAPRWPQELVTSGQLGEQQPYALDTVELPPSNPWSAWLRTSAIDFFPDGRAAVSTHGGDVWIVSGLDASLDEVRWRRFAGGMFEPMGVRIVDDYVHVTCRDRITRLHDVNQDGEADFYESFFADPDVSTNFHAFNFDLQTDADGRFYYAKSGQYTDFALPGAIMQVARDGESYAVWCTGLRTPNGMGMSPDGRPLVSDNQGNWIPASKISLTRRDGFYGVFKAINTNAPGKQTREDFDQPVLWMPQRFDSSSGGQLWVEDARFGPLAGRYLHTSFGKGWMYALSVSEVDGHEQGAAHRLPFQFDAGVQRLRVNPADGQVYAVGLSGWQGPSGGSDGCLQRVRYTGAPGLVLLAARATATGVELEFSEPLDREWATDLAHYAANRWNYRWSRNYGSAHYSIERPGEKGEDALRVMGASLDRSGRRLSLALDPMGPAHQLHVRLDARGVGGDEVREDVYLTIHALPE